MTSIRDECEFASMEFCMAIKQKHMLNLEGKVILDIKDDTTEASLPFRNIF
jgi:hypothetical protein